MNTTQQLEKTNKTLRLARRELAHLEAEHERYRLALQQIVTDHVLEPAATIAYRALHPDYIDLER